MGTQEGLLCRVSGGGRSCVVGPDGRRLTPSSGDGKPDTEGIVYANLDLSKAVEMKGFLEVVGHYGRPGLLWLGVDKRQKEILYGRKEPRESSDQLPAVC